MPWCPRCDETFPEGPSCPRCRTTLVDSGPSHADDALPTVVLPPLKVPRRLRRALGGPAPHPPPPRHLIALSMALVLLAGGFMLGRMSAFSPDSPAVHPAPAEALRIPADGSVSYVRSGALPSDYVLLRASLRSGATEAIARFSSPFSGMPAGRDIARVRGFAGSVAVVLSEPGGRSGVAAFPESRPPVLWLDGDEAAWESATVLLVREGESITRWRLGDGVFREPVPGRWRALFQTAAGAVLEGAAGEGLFVAAKGGPTRTIVGAPEADTLAVSADATHALVLGGDRIQIWDGTTRRPVDVDEVYQPGGAAFSPDGGRIAIVLSERGHVDRAGSRLLAVLSSSGEKIMLSPLPAGGGSACPADPVWDADGRWVYVAPGDGSVHASEVGGLSRSSDVRSAGCGVAWYG